MAASHTVLKGVSEAGNALLSEQIRDNVIEFFNWGLLGVGAYFSVRRGTTAPYGSDPARLRPVVDENFSNGQVWESYRNDWVWQTGIYYHTQPIDVSGVWVNGLFHSKDSNGPYSHVINYPEGRIVFHNPISTTSAVTAEYSYRMFKFDSDNSLWYKQLQTSSMRVDDANFLAGSGDWGILASARVQLPAVIVEIPSARTYRPLEMGGGQIARQAVDFQIIAESSWDKDSLVDIISYQNDRTIWLFNKNYVRDNDMFPIGVSGERRENARMYPTLVSESGLGGAAWRKMTILDATARPARSIPGLFTATVRYITEVDMHDI